VNLLEKEKAVLVSENENLKNLLQVYKLAEATNTK
jgi:hypothetical protein